MEHETIRQKLNELRGLCARKGPQEYTAVLDGLASVVADERMPTIRPGAVADCRTVLAQAVAVVLQHSKRGWVNRDLLAEEIDLHIRSLSAPAPIDMEQVRIRLAEIEENEGPVWSAH